MSNLKYDLSAFVATLKDPRRSEGKRHKLEDIILIIIMAIISGEQGIRGFERFASTNEKELTELLKLKHGVPSFQTFQHIFSELNEDYLAQKFMTWLKTHEKSKLHEDSIIAIDGKAISATYSGKQTKQQNFVMVVNAFGHTSGLVHGMKAFENKKAHESHNLRELIIELGYTKKVYTADALHCQKKL